MKKTVIKGIAFVVIVVISLVVISMVANQGNGDMTAPMPAASLPTMAIVEDGQEINQMYGYTMQMDTADMRESITPIKTARQINAVVHGYGTEIAGVSYELRSIDGSRLIENTELTGTQEGDDLYLSFRLKDLMKEGEEYSLIFLVNLDESRQVRYYTRVIQADYYLTEKLDFVPGCDADREAADLGKRNRTADSFLCFELSGVLYRGRQSGQRVRDGVLPGALYRGHNVPAGL